MNYGQIMLYLRPQASNGVEYFAHADGVMWVGPGVGPTQQEIADAELPAAKSFAVAANRAEARRRILARWPLEQQSSATLGIYPQSVADTMRANIAAVIAAENDAADLIDAATTVAEVEAVVPNWPVI